jgi:hypothetical protein
VVGDASWLWKGGHKVTLFVDLLLSGAQSPWCRKPREPQRETQNTWSAAVSHGHKTTLDLFAIPALQPIPCKQNNHQVNHRILRKELFG